MMLITETLGFDQVETEIIKEASVDGGIAKKRIHIRGPFMESEIRNGNGRVYPRPVIEKEVKRLMESRIPQNRFLGELNHPNVIEVNLERVSHLIKELRMEGNVAVGKAALLDTPMGLIAQALVEGGVKIGISSRGVGTLRESIVQNDFRVSAIDLVSDPSAPNALMDIVMEGKKEWVMENGILTEKELQDTVAEVNKIIIENQFSKEDRAAATLKMFNECLAKIQMKHVVK